MESRQEISNPRPTTQPTKFEVLHDFLVVTAVVGKSDARRFTPWKSQVLLHSRANAVVIVFRFDDGDRNIGLVIHKDVIGALCFAAGDELPSDDDASFGKVDLLADIHHPFPARAFHSGAYGAWSRYRAR